eukprot:10863377-Prorocentrum_lima.AAC.1
MPMRPIGFGIVHASPDRNRHLGWCRPCAWCRSQTTPARCDPDGYRRAPCGSCSCVIPICSKLRVPTFASSP